MTVEKEGTQAGPIQVCILAGGKSSRMGMDKGRVAFAGRTMLDCIQAVVQTAFEHQPDISWRVIRKDCVPRCGPLGGVVTAMRDTRARGLLFLACDMPLISPMLLRRVLGASRAVSRPVFAIQQDRIGFPFLLLPVHRPTVEQHIKLGDFSLHSLAIELNATYLPVAARSRLLANVNTPEDLRAAERTWTRRLNARRPAKTKATLTPRLSRSAVPRKLRS